MSAETGLKFWRISEWSNFTPRIRLYMIGQENLNELQISMTEKHINKYLFLKRPPQEELETKWWRKRHQFHLLDVFLAIKQKGNPIMAIITLRSSDHLTQRQMAHLVNDDLLVKHGDFPYS